MRQYLFQMPSPKKSARSSSRGRAATKTPSTPKKAAAATPKKARSQSRGRAATKKVSTRRADLFVLLVCNYFPSLLLLQLLMRLEGLFLLMLFFVIVVRTVFLVAVAFIVTVVVNVDVVFVFALAVLLSSSSLRLMS